MRFHEAARGGTRISPRHQEVPNLGWNLALHRTGASSHVKIKKPNEDFSVQDAVLDVTSFFGNWLL